MVKLNARIATVNKYCSPEFLVDVILPRSVKEVYEKGFCQPRMLTHDYERVVELMRGVATPDELALLDLQEDEVWRKRFMRLMCIEYAETPERAQTFTRVMDRMVRETPRETLISRFLMDKHRLLMRLFNFCDFVQTFADRWRIVEDCSTDTDTRSGIIHNVTKLTISDIEFQVCIPANVDTAIYASHTMWGERVIADAYDLIYSECGKCNWTIPMDAIRRWMSYMSGGLDKYVLREDGADNVAGFYLYSNAEWKRRCLIREPTPNECKVARLLVWATQSPACNSDNFFRSLPRQCMETIMWYALPHYTQIAFMKKGCVFS